MEARAPLRHAIYISQRLAGWLAVLLIQRTGALLRRWLVRPPAQPQATFSSDTTLSFGADKRPHEKVFSQPHRGKCSLHSPLLSFEWHFIRKTLLFEFEKMQEVKGCVKCSFFPPASMKGIRYILVQKLSYVSRLKARISKRLCYKFYQQLLKSQYFIKNGLKGKIQELLSRLCGAVVSALA
jgi:hypothetical protein